MKKIKIILEGSEAPEEQEETLYKALAAQRDGSTHVEPFEDPAMEDIYQKLLAEHQKTWKSMMREIEEVLDQEHE